MTLFLVAQPAGFTLPTDGPSRASLWGMARTNRSAAALLGMTRNTTMATGWLLPSGELRENAYGEHLTAAAAMGQPNPEAAGWVHVSAGQVRCGDRRPTRRQVDAIIDLVSAGRAELPGFMMAQAA